MSRFTKCNIDRLCESLVYIEGCSIIQHAITHDTRKERVAEIMQEMLYVKETPWKGLGTQYPTQPENMADMVKKAKLDWEVSYLPMSTERTERVLGYHAIYREDTKDLLGVVNKVRPILVQNAVMFNAFDYLLGESVDVETASSFDGGQTVFGSFKVREQYKLLDDDIDHYFVVVNDHLKPDGKVSVLNTPVRVVCQNTLELALHKNYYCLRVPVGLDESVNRSVSASVLQSVGDAIINLQKRAEDLVMKKTSEVYTEKVMDELFPFIKVDGESIYNKTNENIEIMRETFKNECLDADNLNNYRGTQWQWINALADYTQHWYKKADHAYDLGYRMKKLTGVGVPSEPNLLVKYLKISDKISV